MQFAGELAAEDGTAKAIATPDATFAQQHFGGRSREIELLDKIERNGSKLLEKMFFEGGISGG